MKVAVIGGGSTYTPELVNGFLARVGQLPVSELWLMDIDAARLAVVGGFAQRMVESQGSPFQVVLTTDQRAAVRGRGLRPDPTARRADGGPPRGRIPGPAPRADRAGDDRHRRDGQGAAHHPGHPADRRRHARAGPGCAAGQLHQPLRAGHPGPRAVRAGRASVGVCNGPLTTKMGILQGLESKLGGPVDPQRAELKALGLNHLSWYRGFELDGEDIWPQVFQRYRGGAAKPTRSRNGMGARSRRWACCPTTT